MDDGYKKIADGYLYKIYNAALREYPGEVIVHERRNKMMSSGRRGRALFQVNCGLPWSYKNLTVCINAGEVYNGMLWLKESDICRAAKILWNYENEKMLQLYEENQIHIHRSEILEHAFAEQNGGDH